jgi:beta-lactamase superfamily II metal-dependent hydrolase
VLRIRALPAANGDALLLEYGGRQVRRVLIDGGTEESADVLIERLRSLEVRRLDLLVVTHVDTDHIGGALPLIERTDHGIDIARVWFNGFTHLKPQPKREDRLGTQDRLGPIHGERLTAGLVKRVDARLTTWNEEFGGGTVIAGETRELDTGDPENLKLTVLSPTWEKLKKLVPKWEPLVKAGGLVAGAKGDREEGARSDRLGAPRLDLVRLAETEPGRDASDANGSSIALLAEYAGRRILLAGDAHADVLVASIAQLRKEQRDLDLFKLPHHGSASNVTENLVKAVRCRKYLFSTNGKGFKNPHPHREAVARVIVHAQRPELVFNYRAGTTNIWNEPLPKIGKNDEFEFTPRYGKGGEVVVSWRT